MPYGFMDKVNNLQRIFREKRNKPYDRAFDKIKYVLDYGKDIADTARSGFEDYRENARIKKNRTRMRMNIYAAGLCRAEEDFWRKMNGADSLSMDDCFDPRSPYSHEVFKIRELVADDLNPREKIYRNP